MSSQAFVNRFHQLGTRSRVAAQTFRYISIYFCKGTWCKRTWTTGTRTWPMTANSPWSGASWCMRCFNCLWHVVMSSSLQRGIVGRFCSWWGMEGPEVCLIRLSLSTSICIICESMCSGGGSWALVGFVETSHLWEGHHALLHHHESISRQEALQCANNTYSHTSFRWPTCLALFCFWVLWLHD